MIIIKTLHIKGSDDLELNIQRESDLTYHMAYDDQKEPDGIIFSVPGFGEDSDISYQLNLISHIAKTYNLLAICVEYHCFFSRIRTGASYGFNDFDTKIFLDIIQRYKIQLDPNHLDFDSVVEKLNQYVSSEKSKDPSFSNYRENIFATILPKKNEYQNFGLLQSIDILTVLYHIKSLGFEQLISRKPLFAFGSSHGAYIVNLLMKIAPNTFDAIIDNSAYIKPPLKYIIGQEYNSKEAETLSKFKDSVLIHAFTLTNWTLNSTSPYHFDTNALEIRDLSNIKQLQQFIKYKSKTQIISYHSTQDNISSYKEKEQYLKILKDSNQTIKFTTISDKKQIDNKLIKNLEHSMGMSNKELLKQNIPILLKKYIHSDNTDLCNKSIIQYTASLDTLYQFQYTQNRLIFSIKKPKLK